MRKTKLQQSTFIIAGIIFLTTHLGGVPFTDSMDGTVTDTATNLTWQKCSAAEIPGGISGDNIYNATCNSTARTYTWSNALHYCKNLSLAGKTWRLPSVNELKSIRDSGRCPPCADSTIFPNTVNSAYWSASSYALNNAQAWYVDFAAGGLLQSNKTSLFRVRCVTGP
ncbi:MAG: DUF1566 domain-containing protein [Leptonema illini]|uniref:DUF1566 domain-containing protein n=1 Tax=Leptonema illini TaxID=183 RepID=A0A833LXV2_9LEPT|nr:MAG: DUF1566 domain-containing protein [Leptonema illini]